MKKKKDLYWMAVPLLQLDKRWINSQFQLGWLPLSMLHHHVYKPQKWLLCIGLASSSCLVKRSHSISRIYNQYCIAREDQDVNILQNLWPVSTSPHFREDLKLVQKVGCSLPAFGPVTRTEAKHPLECKWSNPTTILHIVESVTYTCPNNSHTS